MGYCAGRSRAFWRTARAIFITLQILNHTGVSVALRGVF
jgi:hypothetical protein